MDVLFPKGRYKGILLPTLNEVGSPFLSIRQRSIWSLVTVRFNIVIPWHRPWIPDFTSFNAQFSLTPRSSALLNNYLFVIISKTQNYWTLKIVTIFFSNTKQIHKTLFWCSLVTTYELFLQWPPPFSYELARISFLGSILCGTGMNYSYDQLNMICWQFLIYGPVTPLLQGKIKLSHVVVRPRCRKYFICKRMKIVIVTVMIFRCPWLKAKNLFTME